MPVISQQSELGNIFDLQDVTAESLKELGEMTLPPGFHMRTIGAESPDSAQRRILRQIGATGLLNEVCELAYLSAGPLRLLGIEIIRAEPRSLQYRRPLPEDHIDEHTEKLAAFSQAQVPLEGHLIVEGFTQVPPALKTMLPSNRRRESLDLGQVFVPYPELVHTITMPSGALNMEFIFGQEDMEPEVAWQEYITIQAHPHD